MSSTQIKISVPSNHLMPLLLGERDEVLRAIEAAFPSVAIHVRGNEIALDGDDDVERVARLLEDLVVLVEQGHRLDAGTVRRSVEMVRHDERPAEVLSTEVLRPARGRPVRPKSSGQKRYVDAIRENVITFGVGPAGTGKSWLAVAMAVQALQAKEVDRIILTRPAVEAGERLGFLPGRPDGQGRPVPAAAVGRPARHGRAPRTPASCSSGARWRSRRSRSCAAAR